jgi:hypothetical protein
LGSDEGQFREPAAVQTDGAGNIVVTDLGNARIEVFDASGEFLFQFGGRGDGGGLISDTCGAVAVDSRGRFLVADAGNDLIQVFERV